MIRDEYSPTDKMRIIVLCVVLVAISVLHFSTGISTNVEHILHVSLRLAYFIPLMLSALWYGARGAVLLSVAFSFLFSAHLFVSWSGNLGENINQVAIIFLFPLIGIGAGILVDREDAARRRRDREEKSAARHAVIESFSALSAALNAKDSYTSEHSDYVANLAVRIGVELKLPEDTLDLLHMAGAVHDIGKIGLRDDVLFKDSGLEVADREHMRQHPEIAATILRPISGAERVAEMVLCHHEYLDGSGYPRGIKRDDIPIEARILTVADIYSALIDQRPYKAERQSEEALEVLRSISGVKVDARVVQALEAVLRKEKTLQPDSKIQVSTRSNSR